MLTEKDVENIQALLEIVVQTDDNFRQTGKTRTLIKTLHDNKGKVIGIVSSAQEKKRHLGYPMVHLGELHEYKGLVGSGATIAYDPSAVASLCRDGLSAIRSLRAEARLLKMNFEASANRESDLRVEISRLDSKIEEYETRIKNLEAQVDYHTRTGRP